MYSSGCQSGAAKRCNSKGFAPLLLVVQIMDCLSEQAHAATATPRSSRTTALGAVLEAVLSRSLAHPHIVPTYDWAIMEEVGMSPALAWASIGCGTLGAPMVFECMGYVKHDTALGFRVQLPGPSG